MAVAEALPAGRAPRWRGLFTFGESRTLSAVLLLAPAVLFFVVVFVIPVGLMIRYSFYQQTSTGDLTASATLANYVRLASVDLYRTVVMTTLRVSAWTTFIAMLLAYPLALVMVRGHPLIGRALTVIVLAPLLINVVVRTYAWRVILANGDNGVLNWTLAHFGLGPVQLLYTEWAIIIGSVVMFLLVVIRMSLAIEQIAYAHEALEKLQDELAVQATHDPLTGLANRTQSMRLLAGALGRARRRQATVGLLFIDLDGFKSVNDNHGHRSGDEVLRHVARRMKQQVREGDFVARLGGDEFVVGVEDVTDEASIVALAHRLIAAVSQPIQIGEDLTVQVGASVGIALGRGGETDVETLLHEADLAVYRAKAAGRGCAELFSWTARAALKERTELERALVGAIADNELVLHFQPIVNAESGLVDCFEALVRWDRPGFGLLPPDEFLPVAESSDLICQLDTWVLRESVAQLSRWNRMRGDRTLKVAVNVSGRHVSQHRIQSDVAGALRVSTVDPGQLVIEVTETALMDGSVAATNLQALRNTGVIVSLDDFGTGYQSSAQLSRLPVDVLKIDRRFVDTSSAAARSLLELMVKAAHAFGAEVVAEGVENEEELAFAREIGCEYVQGYHIAQPAPADQLATLDNATELAG